VRRVTKQERISTLMKNRRTLMHADGPEFGMVVHGRHRIAPPGTALMRAPMSQSACISVHLFFICVEILSCFAACRIVPARGEARRGKTSGFGSLDRHKAAKGPFVTTSAFSPAARETAEFLSKRIVLIDGAQLTVLMIRHNVGCHVEDTLHIKKIDEDFFE
jgi:hypothetical protein